MIRPLATLAFAAAFLAAGALAPVAGVAESKTPLTGSDSRNVTVLEKNRPADQARTLRRRSMRRRMSFTASPAEWPGENGTGCASTCMNHPPPLAM